MCVNPAGPCKSVSVGNHIASVIQLPGAPAVGVWAGNSGPCHARHIVIDRRTADGMG